MFRAPNRSVTLRNNFSRRRRFRVALELESLECRQLLAADVSFAGLIASRAAVDDWLASTPVEIALPDAVIALGDAADFTNYETRTNGATIASEWQQLGKLQHPRTEPANAVVDGKIYVFGGIRDAYDGPSQIERYDPAANRWTVIGTMPLARHHVTAGSSVHGDEIWIVGGKTGDDNSGIRRVDVFNTVSNTWRRGPDLPAAHWGGAAVVVGNKLHVLTGGEGNRKTTNHHFVLNLNNEAAGWSTAARVPAPRVHVAGVALNGQIYLVGGELHHNHDVDTNTVQVYNPATDSWSLAPSNLPQARSHSEWATFTYNGTILSVSGVNSTRNPRGQSEIYQYNPSSNAWKLFAQLPDNAVSPGAKVIGNKLYVFGGSVNDWFVGPMNRTISLNLAEADSGTGNNNNNNNNNNNQATPPVIDDQNFSVPEDLIVGQEAGFIQARNGSSGQKVYEVTGGDGLSIFNVNAATGRVTLARNLDFETKSTYRLLLRVYDPSTPNLQDTAIVQIRVTNVAEVDAPPTPAATRPIINDEWFSITENTSPGSAVGRILLQAGDTSDVRYTVIEGNGQALFNLNADTGAITVANNATLDFETQAAYSLVVRVNSRVDNTLFDSGNVRIELLDVPEPSTPVPPRISDQSFSIPENSAAGRSVGTIALDRGNIEQTHLTIIGGSGASRFVINSATGQISVAANAALDFESQAFFTLQVQVRSKLDGSLTDTAEIGVQLTDVNEQRGPGQSDIAPVIRDEYFAVSENAAAGTSIGRLYLQAGTPNQVMFRIVGGTGESKFSMNAVSGQIFVRTGQQLDYESTKWYTLDVLVHSTIDRELVDFATMQIEVLNVAEPGSPTPSPQPRIDDQAFSVPENADIGRAVGSLQLAGVAVNEVTYEIVGGDEQAVFSVDANGRITVAAANLDFESQPEYSLRVRVTSKANPALIDGATISIQLLDVFESPRVGPQISDQYFTVPAHTDSGTTVGWLTLTQGNPNDVRYAVTGGDGQDLFSVEPLTGKVVVAAGAQIDYEQSDRYSLQIRARNLDDGSLFADATVFITVRDVVEQAAGVSPIVADQHFSVSADANAGRTMGVVQVNRRGSAANLQFLEAGGSGAPLFSIERETGRIYVSEAVSLAHLGGRTFELSVRVAALDDARIATTATLYLRVDALPGASTMHGVGLAEQESVSNPEPINKDDRSTIDVEDQFFSVHDDAETGQTAGTIRVKGVETPLSFNLTGGSGTSLFVIEPLTGKIKIAAGDSNPLPAGVYTLQVRVFHQDDPTVFGTAMIRVEIKGAAVL